MNVILLKIILTYVVLLNAIILINIQEILQNSTILNATLPCVILLNVTTLFINCY